MFFFIDCGKALFQRASHSGVFRQRRRRQLQTAIPPAFKDEATYLVICRGDDLFTSGMVLTTPLKVEVQTHGASRRVRANELDTA